MEKRTVFINTQVVTMEESAPLIKEGFLAFSKGVIAALGPLSDYQPASHDEVIDLKGKIIMPGLINTHTHLGLVPLRSMADDMPDRLRKFLFPMEMRYLTADLTAKSSLFAAAESLKSGVTTVADMYYFTDEVATSLSQIGIRAFCGQTIIAENGADRLSEKAALAKTRALAEKWHGHPKIKIMVAPHGTTTVSEATLIEADQIAQDYQIKLMIHVSEMDYEMEHFATLHQMTPIEYLNQIGILSDRLISVHSIFAQKQDFKLLADHKVNVVHCLSANLKSAKGFMDLKAMLDHGVNVSIGTDGPISGNTLDLWTQIRFLPLVHKTINQDRSYLPSYEILKLATINGAKTLGIEHEVGSLEVGKKADLVIIDPFKLHSFPVHDVFASLVYSVNASNVEAVLIDGQWIVEDYQLVKMAESEIFTNLKNALPNFEID